MPLWVLPALLVRLVPQCAVLVSLSHLVGIFWPGAAHGSLLSPEPAMSLCTQFQVLLPTARGQQVCDTAAAVTPWLGTPTAPCAFVCVRVPCTCVHICAHVCLWVCLCPWEIPAWLQAIPSQASIGTGRVWGMEQDSGSFGQLPPWQLSRESSCLAATTPWWCGE